MVSDSAVGKMITEIEAGAFIGVLFDHKASGEANSRPHLRMVAFRDEFCIGSIKGVIQAFNSLLGGEAEGLPDQGLFFMMDGHVHGNEIRMTSKPFTDAKGKPLKKEKKLLFLTKTQSSILATTLRGANGA